MAKSVRLDDPVPVKDDVEGHAFRWDVTTDPDGKKRMQQRWNDADGAPGTRQPTKSGIERRPSQEGR
jgi:hypothetical protein